MSHALLDTFGQSLVRTLTLLNLRSPIDVFVSYEGKRAGDIAVSRYAVRNLVSQEIEAELLRRHQAAFPDKGEHAMFKKYVRRASFSSCSDADP